MKKALALVLGLLFFGVASAKDAALPNILEFQNMAGVQGPFRGATNAIRGIPGAGAAWRVGKLEISVRGLVLNQGPLAGTNPIPNFQAVVSCQSIDGLGNPSIVNLTTNPFPATAAGDADVEADVQLPSPCIAPIVFLTLSPNIRWIAVTGQ